MVESNLIKKLQLKPQMRVAVISAPEGYLEQLGLSTGLNVSSEPEVSIDFLQIFVKNKGDLEKSLPEALRVLKHDGLFWITYPKGSSKLKTDLNRDIIWKYMEQYHLAGIAMVAINDIWSAMRFRPVDRVGK